MSPRVIVIEGPIGAGKSTLVDVLATAYRAKGLKVCTIQEPIAAWEKIGIFQAYCKSPAQHIFAFQICTFTTRIKAVQAAVQAMPDADVYILERSVLTDNIFMELHRAEVGEMYMAIYQQFYDLSTQTMPLDLSTATFLVLKPTPEECMKRVEARARTGEVETKATAEGGDTKGGVTINYQRQIIRAHEAYFEGLHSEHFTTLKTPPFPRTNVVVVDGELAAANFKTTDADRVGAALITRLDIA